MGERFAIQRIEISLIEVLRKADALGGSSRARRSLLQLGKEVIELGRFRVLARHELLHRQTVTEVGHTLANLGGKQIAFAPLLLWQVEDVARLARLHPGLDELRQLDHRVPGLPLGEKLPLGLGGHGLCDRTS